MYYLRLLNLIESDIDIMISEPDITKRSPKVILEYLKMATQCQESLQNDSAADEWENLPTELQVQIDAIIESYYKSKGKK